jgi:hypothetical protein
MSGVSAKKLCFVVGPIGDEGSETRVHADWLLHGVIRPVLCEFPDFQVKRADHDARPGHIDVQMINDLINAELVIGDLSLQNPNAFYEIGIRHMAQKPIIHMQLTTEIVPFDVSLYRAIKFARTRFSDVEKAKEYLKNVVNAVLAPDYQPENPVTNAIGRLKLEQNATPEMRVVMEEIDGLKTQVDILRQVVVGTSPLLSPPEPDRRIIMDLQGHAASAFAGRAAPNALSAGVAMSDISSVNGVVGNSLTSWRTK